MADMSKWSRVFPWMNEGFELDGRTYAGSYHIVRRSADPKKDDAEKLKAYLEGVRKPQTRS
jgi:hypothetical protein